MTNIQLYIAVGIPLLFNATLIGLVVGYMNAKFAASDEKLAAINTRLDHMQEMWRSELRRVEEIIDLRLKHLEPR